MIQRDLLMTISQKAKPGKALLLIGARQVGKTTLLHQYIDRFASDDAKVLWLNCDRQEVRDAVQTTNLHNLELLIGSNKTVVIDEAQRVNDIGLTLKLIVDNMPDVTLLVTGSSAFELRNRINEPLTGRKSTLHLFPLSTKEIYDNQGLIGVNETFESRLIYGSYPAVLLGDEPQEMLTELADSYLYKDILEIDGLRRTSVLNKLVVVLALQVGSEVSYNELAKTVGIDRKTVEKYIDLLEKCYVVFALNSYNRNIRTELTKGKKIYFYDNGIRNAVIRNFAPLEYRQDTGALWENFFIAERIKANRYAGRAVNSYFWRTTDKKEIDYIEEANGHIAAFELKWNPKKAKTTLPVSFINAYNPGETHVVTPQNYLEYVL